MPITRRTLLFSAASVPLLACSADAQQIPSAANEARFAASSWRRLTEAQWRERLSPLAFRVLRQEATERAGTSPLDAEEGRGVYVCAGCGLELFRSEWKYHSGTGWPSFFRVMEANVGTKQDFLLLTPRTRVCDHRKSNRADRQRGRRLASLGVEESLSGVSEEMR